MFEWHLGDRILRIERRPLIMGIVNVTPDSFSDGGKYVSFEAATAHALELVRQGADILDIGGESTRPGAEPVPLDEELRRVLPVVASLAKQTTAVLSLDTSKAEVADAGLACGARIVNDVTGLAGDPKMVEVVRRHRAGVVLMHMQGAPRTMQRAPYYADVVAEIGAFFEDRVRDVTKEGIGRGQIVLDPGIGFGKTGTHNLQILARLQEFQKTGLPVCLGVSRKGFIGWLNQQPVEKRLPGSLAALCYALGKQAVQVIRVHDVEATRDAVTVFLAIEEQGGERSVEGTAATTL